MQTRRFTVLTFTVFSIGMTTAALSAAELNLKKGDHICLVGNALGERMQHHNRWES